MVNQELMNWIRNEEAQGYSEEQVKQILFSKGYSQKDIDEAINTTIGVKKEEKSELSFDEFLNKKGRTVKYFILTSIGILSFSLLSFLSFIPAQSIVNIGEVPTYILIGVYSLLIGFVIAKVNNEISTDSKDFAVKAMFLSIGIALISSVNSMIFSIIQKVQEHLTEISVNMGAGNIIPLFNPNIIDANIAFIIIFISFNIPFLYYFFKRKDKKPAWLLLYLIPILSFIILSYIYNVIVDMIVSLINSLINSKLPPPVI